MSARGIGAFLEGASEGYEKGEKAKLEQARAKREEESHKQQMAIGNQTLAKGEIDLNRAKAEENMKKQISEGLKALNEQAAGGIEGDVVDQTGNVVGRQKFADINAAQQQLGQQGYMLKPDTVKQIAPLNDFQKNRAMFDIITKARADNGLIDEQSLAAQIERTRKMKKEGVEDAFQHFLTTGDSNGAIELFNQSGGIKAPKGAFLKREVDPETGVADVAVFAPGKNGQPERVTSMNEYLASTNSEALGNFFLNMRKEQYTQKKETERSEARNKTTLSAAAIEAKAKVDAELIGLQKARGALKDPNFEKLKDIILDLNGKVASNATNSYDIDGFRQNVFDQMNLATKLLSEGKAATPEEAASMAFRDLKGGTPQSKLESKKK